MNIPKPGEIYRHYKHDPLKGEKDYTYEIVAIGFNTVQEVDVVVYRPLYESDFLAERVSNVFVRDLSEFIEEVEVGGVVRSRFVKIDHIGK